MRNADTTERSVCSYLAMSVVLAFKYRATIFMRIIALASLLSVFVPATAAAEVIPKRVVLLDALELTPALEKANAR